MLSLLRHDRGIVTSALATTEIDGVGPRSGAIDVDVAVTLVLEVVFGTAKMAPMPRAAFDRVSRPKLN